MRTQGCYRVLYILLDPGIYRWCNNGVIVERQVGLYSVESAADSSADKSTEVSGEALLTDASRSIPEPMVYKAQPLESKVPH